MFVFYNTARQRRKQIWTDVFHLRETGPHISPVFVTMGRNVQEWERPKKMDIIF